MTGPDTAETGCSGRRREKIKVGISACLLGRQVRYNGGHKLDVYLRDVLGAHVEWVPVCPETECGLSIPREPMDLYGTSERTRLLTTRTGNDCTELMTGWCERRLTELGREDLCGFVLKQDSPSCGLERVLLHDGLGRTSRNGRGLFAQALLTHCPDLPVVEAEMLRDRWERERFLDRIFTAGRWRAARQAGRGEPAAFYARHRWLLMSRSPGACAELEQRMRTGTEEAFRAALDGILALPSGVSGHCRVLRGMLRELTPALTAWEAGKLREAISGYATGTTGLAAALALFLHYAEKYENLDLLNQTCRDWLLPVYAC